MSTAIAAIRSTAPRAAGATAIVAAAVLSGALVAVQPFAGLALMVFVVLVGMAFLLPAAYLTLLLFISVIVPYGIQNTLATGLLLPSDALLLTALLAAGMVLLQERLEPRRFLAIAVIVAFLLAIGLQALQGLQLGRSASQVGYELRVLLGFGTFLIAMPLVADRLSWLRLGRGLVVIGLLLGVWGLAQWFLGIEEINESGVGVREGVSFAESGRGQLQGGVYSFPVAVLMSFAVLVSGGVRSLGVRTLLLAVLFLNLACLLLTYERTFWVTTLLGVGFVMLRAGRAQRGRALVWAATTLVLLLAVMATLAPSDFTAARERLVSLSQYASDDSVRSRVVESRHVLDQIKDHPIVGSGLGATIYWGRPWQQVPPKANWYAHNGYLWLSWKLGIPAALLLVGVLAWAAVSRRPRGTDPLLESMRMGSQAALLALLLSSVTFPSFNGGEITAVMGVLAAIALAPPLGRPATRLSSRSA